METFSMDYMAHSSRFFHFFETPFEKRCPLFLGRDAYGRVCVAYKGVECAILNREHALFFTLMFQFKRNARFPFFA